MWYLELTKVSVDVCVSVPEPLTTLIDAAREAGVAFVYAISPGLDITYSSAKDVTCLKHKLEQVASFGCEAFALLFDDIDVELCDADKSQYQSFATAQACYLLSDLVCCQAR